jgi:uncharacterized protein (DUF2236 family)
VIDLPLERLTSPVTRPAHAIGDAVGGAVDAAGSAVTSAVDSAVNGVRRQIGGGVRRMVAGDHAPVRDLSRPVDGDPGLFGPDSVTWRIHADASMFVGGLRALLLQMLHPLAMAGVADHSDYRRHPERRLARTALFVAETTYGTTRQAEDAFALVRRVHRNVTGTAPDGRPYSAGDPHLVAWVHHAEVDSFLRAYQRYGSESLSKADADRYVAEMAVVCERLGGEPPARSVAELRSYFSSVRPELRAGAQARDAARWLMVPPLPLPARPAYAIIAPAAVGLLPGWAQRELWLPLLPGVDPVVVRPAARFLLRTLAWAVTGPGVDLGPEPGDSAEPDAA